MLSYQVLIVTICLTVSEASNIAYSHQVPAPPVAPTAFYTFQPYSTLGLVPTTYTYAQKLAAPLPLAIPFTRGVSFYPQRAGFQRLAARLPQQPLFVVPLQGQSRSPLPASPLLTLAQRPIVVPQLYTAASIRQGHTQHG
ncbi:unnamed protein product [Bemisia tabaci]|uniref:Uncharacterized protein n=1 Tax=Bemisia tabaci TaxID=7038 RepID=A0A9P0CAE2_BEMTA|nr:unnamed protein product [Bemisia tabaci]